MLHTLGSVWDFGMNTFCDRSVVKSAEDWDVTIADEKAEDALHRTVTIRTPEGDLRFSENYRRTSTYLIVYAPEEHLIKTKADFELLRRYDAGAMFRYERPQKGRYRQFHQVGAEAFGLAGPDVDVELMAMGASFWQALGVAGQVRLEINTLGSPGARTAYRDALVGYLNPLRDRLDEDSRRRLDRNPLRILDSKDPGTRELLEGAPRLPEFIEPESRAHFARLGELLDELGIAYQVNPRLVRGLDYYTQTVFEWVTDALGTPGAVCAGGHERRLVLGPEPLHEPQDVRHAPSIRPSRLLKKT